MAALTRQTLRVGRQAVKASARAAPRRPATPTNRGEWTTGIVMGAAGARRFRLYRPPGLRPGERVPLLVMLHGCGQDANGFALSTRMNQVAARERFLVLYPEQDRLAHPQGCWHWYDTRSGRAQAEVALIMASIERVCHQQPVDAQRIAIAGLSAGASMAALVATQHPQCFKALAMHSGVRPGAAHSTLSALGAMKGRPSGAATAPTPRAAGAIWPALLVIHGEADGVVAPGNGRAAAQAWATAGHARAGAPRPVQRGRRHPMTVTDFKGRGGTSVSTLVEIACLGHAWSGAAAKQPFGDQHGPDASRMVWAFAAKQFGRSAPQPARR